MSDKIGFPVGLADGLIKEEKVARRPIVDWDKEIPDMEEGWVYARRGNKKGKRLRKFLQPMAGYYRDDSPLIWMPRVNDLVTAEAKRWKALEYRVREITPLLKVFELVRDNAPFCCVHITDHWPECTWVKFPRTSDGSYGNSIGVSWDWVKGKEKPNLPQKQDIGDAWFAYESRSSEVRRRVGLFESLFQMALEKRYADEFYRHRDRTFLRNLVINGRTYLVGRKEGGGFGVIAYPEDIITEVVK